jgi:hypothetical protein
MAIGACSSISMVMLSPGMHHFGPAQQLGAAGDVRRAEVELRTIPGEERRMTAAFFLGQHVHFGFELGVRRDRLGSAQNLAAFQVVLFNASQQHPTLSPAMPLVQRLVERFDTGDDVVLFGLSPTISTVSPTLHLPRSIRPVPTVPRPLMLKTSSIGIRNGLSISRCGIGTYSSSAFTSSSITWWPCHRPGIVKRRQRRTADDRGVVAGEAVLGQQFADFHLDQLEQFGIVDQVDLVEEHHDLGHADLTGEQDVLAGLGHGAVGGGHDQNRAVHLGGAGDHVLDVVGVARAVDVGVVPGGDSYSTWAAEMVTVLVASRSVPPLAISL